MIRLVDLDPAWITSGDRIIGVTFLCACCKNFPLFLLFAHPPDGGPPQRQDHRVAGDHGGLRFNHSGSTFEDLTIHEHVMSSQANHWSGRITDGEVSGSP